MADSKIHPRSCPRDGFTLTEVMVSICVLTLSVVSMGMLQGMVLRMNELAENMVQAIDACQAKSEEISTEDPAARASGGDTWNRYNRTWSLAGGTSPGTEALTVTATWRDLDGTQHQMSMNAILAN